MRAKNKNHNRAFHVTLLSEIKNEAVQNRRVAPTILKHVSIIGETYPLSKYLDTGMKTPKIVFVANINRCPFNLSDIAKIRKLRPLRGETRADYPHMLCTYKKNFQPILPPYFSAGNAQFFTKKAPRKGAPIRTKLI